MRPIAILVVLSTLAVIIGSAVMVVGKDYEPRLDVQVKGVPGYIYYNRDYKLTVEYTNHGGAIDGPVEVSVVLPETFALAENINDPRRHGETLTWTVEGLDSGETGSFVISVRGTLPEDLTNAVYDLPGYVGHTAFVEGFQMKAAIRAGSSFADTVAIADTGAAQFNSFIRIIKDTQPNSPTLFSFTDNSQICNVPSLEDDGAGNGNDFTCPPIPAGNYVITENDPAPQGYELVNIVCTTTETAIDTTTVDIPNRTANIDLDAGETVTCTFTNVQDATPTPTRTATATRTPSPTATPTQPTATASPTATATLNIGLPNDPPGGGLGAVVAPRAPTTVAPQRPAPAPAVAGIRPPSTGDAGLQ